MRVLNLMTTVAIIVTAACSVANAGALDQAESYLEIKLGHVPTLRVGAKSNTVSLSSGPLAIVEAPDVFEIDDYAIESSAFTGLPLMSGFTLSLDANGGSYVESASYINPLGSGSVTGLGGIGSFNGNAVLLLAGFDAAPPLSPIGFGGTVLAPVLANDLILTGVPFNTGEAKITGITTQVLFAPSLGITGAAFTLNLTTVQLMTAIPLTDNGSPVQTNTVTVRGAIDLTSASQAGSIKMVSPFRIRTDTLNKPGAFTKTFTFVPEPGTVIQLLAGAAVLAFMGKNRTR
jgi:hypothetical protein